MSRREDRTSDTKRHRSRFDREPSPKRSRRDGKPETERPPTNSGDRLERDQKNRRRLQDASPLEAPMTNDSKVEIETIDKESKDTDNKHRGVAKYSTDSAKVLRATSYFQHDDRGSAGQDKRSFSSRMDKERRWRDRNEQQKDGDNDTARASDRYQKDERHKDNNNTQRKDERSKDSRDADRVWRHDEYFEMEANPKPPQRKRPAFREQKVLDETEKVTKSADLVTANPKDRDVESGKRRERPFSGDRELSKSDVRRGNASSFDQNGAGNRYRGGDGFPAGRDSRPSGGRAEKWKHDLYHEANRSPTPKNEEDQISKIEALLAK